MKYKDSDHSVLEEISWFLRRNSPETRLFGTMLVALVFSLRTGCAYLLLGRGTSGVPKKDRESNGEHVSSNFILERKKSAQKKSNG